MCIMINIKNVTKYFDNKTILDNISLQVGTGEIFGFLGPNGAGKSTTMKIICGLLLPDKGTVIINKNDIIKNRTDALKDLSALIEAPKMYPYLTALENLNQLSRLDNISKNAVYEVIDLVGLKGKENEKVKKYSLGMKQRLGIAQAIMGFKKLLILDEPTNGLDADGVIEFRNLIKNLAKDKNITIFISSHKLDEMEKLCDRVAFIANGKIKAIESVNIANISTCIKIFTTNQTSCINALKSLDYINKINNFDGGITIECTSDHYLDICNKIVTSNLIVTNITKEHKTLEDRYLELLGDKND